MKKLIYALTLISALILPAIQSFAQQPAEDTVGLSISPAIVEVAGDPNSRHQATVTVRNTSEQAIPVTLEATSLIPIADEIDRSRRAEFDASSWITISKENLLLKPNEAKPIGIVIDIPPEAEPGGHYAQVGFRLLSQANFNEATNAQIVPVLSAAMFITVSGDVDESAELNTDNLIASYVSKNSNGKLSFIIRNVGNVHILPAPKVTISASSGQITQVTLQPQIILPNTQKELTVDWPADVGYGKYSARVEATYGSENIPIASQEVSFWVGPAWWQILILAILVTPVLVLLFRRRHIPNALKILAGKRIHLVGKRRYSRAGKNDLKEKGTETVGDYEAISQFLGKDHSSSPAKVIPVPEYPTTSAVPAPTETPSTNTVIKEALSKTQDEPISELPVSTKATITEFDNADDKDKKTVIVQTSASTIIRQEPKAQELAEPTVAPTKKIPITYSDSADKAQKTPPKTKSSKPATRSEKVAKKAAKAKKKAQKKKP